MDAQLGFGAKPQEQHSERMVVTSRPLRTIPERTMSLA